MPEGPEIRRAADRIARVLEGQEIESVSFGLPRLKRHGSKLCGASVVEVETRGKAMLTHFDNGFSIYSHNQLYGVWKVARRGKLPKTGRSLRLALHTATHSALLYSASDISVWPTEELSQHPFLARIGPDILNPTLDWRAIADRMLGNAFKGRRLSAIYLDQAFLAGIGNYLRTEILFDAGIHPDWRPVDLTRGERGRLARSTLAISRRSYETGGITLPPRLAASLEREGLRREQRRFFVFGRTHHPCYRCGAEVQREEMNSRRIYWCPDCQEAP
jgi:endonuclease-8